jgi:chloramphenicol 3-O-phosphotransferase
MNGQIVIVTGTSGAGKTTTCQTFARRADDVYLMFGFDCLVASLVAGKFTMFGDRAREFFYAYREDSGNPNGRYRMDFGPAGWRALQAMHAMIAAASKVGQNVVVDHLTFTDPPVLQDCIWRLEGLPVLFVALKPPYEVLRDRVGSRKIEIPRPVADVLGPEAAREIAESLQAIAPWFYESTYANDCFDLVIDSTRFTPDEVCQQIERRLGQGLGTAFEALRQRHPRPPGIYNS